MDLDQGLKIFNTLSRQKEEFAPIKPGYVGIYACGPTVYEKTTIGNFRTYIFEDLLRRILKYDGYKVNFVQNITDVGHLTSDRSMGEDKMERSAKEKNVDAWDLARTLEKEFFEDSVKLNIILPDISCRATEHIADQIDAIKKLEGMGYTYKTSDGIYFNTSKLPNYGKLTHLNKEGLREGARVEINPEKRNLTDFALWKFSPKDLKRQMEWESPWGVGFPGWHIECSAMSIKYLGVPFDIHCGGIDLIPVHHTNEIAQNEAMYGLKTVNYWMHGGFLLINNQRMGKSLGNAYTIDDIIKKGFDPLAYRYLTYTAHYRQELNFTWEALEAANIAYLKLWHTVTALYPFYGDLSGEFNKEWNEKFLEAINDDLNMPKAIAVVWEMIKSLGNSKELLETLLKFDEVLGLSLRNKLERIYKVMQETEIKELMQKRSKARINRDWATADSLRNELQKHFEGLGYEMKDS